ncbi:MAG TPA: DUF5719 family protein [Cellulomonas sp.]
MSGRWLGRVLRTAGALVVVAATGAVVVAGTRLEPVPTPSVTAGAVDVPPAPAAAVCPGPLLVPDATGTGSFSSTPVQPVTHVAVLAVPPDGGALTGTLGSLDGTATAATLASGGGAASVPDPAGPLVAHAEATGGGARLAGVTSALVSAGDLRGLASATCQSPTADAWLVGGSTAVGSTADLVLVNAGSTTAEVTVQVWGPNGAVTLPTAMQLVAPHAQKVVGLGGLAPDQRALAVHVSAAGGQVAAWVQDSALRGYTAAGVELVVPGTAPATRQTIPGVDVEASTGDSPDAPVLRLLAPGDGATTATVSLLGADGPVDLPGTESVTLTGGQVTDVPLGGLPAGTYTVVVDAGAPVAASLEFSRTGTAGELDPTPRVERAWAAATATGGGLAVPAPGTDTTLVVGAVAAGDQATATGSFTGTLRVLGAGGTVLAEKSVEVDAASTGSWPLKSIAADPTKVTGVELLAGDTAVTASWALVAERTQSDGVLVSVLLPAPVATGPARVVVREDPTLGVG